MINLASHLRSIIPLTYEDERLLENVTGPCRQLARRDLLLRAGDLARTLFVLQSGWAASFLISGDGRRCITAISLPGDLIGTAALSHGVATESVVALTPITVLPAPIMEVKALMRENCRIAESCFASMEKDRSALAQSLLTVSRSNSLTTVASLILRLAERCGTASSEGKVIFPFYMTQEHIGDATGLTPVHVNRTIQELRRRGVFERGDRNTIIVDAERLRLFANAEAHGS